MPATFGRKYGDSHPSFALQSSLASRLKVRPEWTGSQEYTVRWKSSVTLLGLQICRLRVLVRRTSEHDSSGSLAGWTTPQTEEPNGPDRPCRAATGRTTEYLGRQVKGIEAASWPTPTSMSPATEEYNRAGDSCNLRKIRLLSPWPTPKASEDGSTLKQFEARRQRGYESRKGKTKGGPASKQGDLSIAVQLSPWPTPNVPSGGRSIAHAEMKGATAYHDGKKVQVGLEATAKMAPWASPQARDEKRGSSTLPPRDRGEPLSQQVTPGTSASSSDAETDDCVGSPSLNPVFSLWLMGFPRAWQDSIPGAEDWSRWQDLMALLSSERNATE